MRLFLFAVCAFALAACSSVPKQPGPGPCADLSEPCETTSENTVAGFKDPPRIYRTIHEPTLIKGRPANPADFPASVWTRSCSATVVGPQAVFIAAHCVDSRRIQFSVGPNVYRGTCQVSSAYSGNATADYAMCLTDKVVQDVPYESLNLDPNLVKLGAEVLLSGYGCVRPGGGGGNDGVYRIGEAIVQRIPSGSNNDIVTARGAALCFGDSGGPAFLFLEPGTSMSRKRVVISTNSRGDIATTSYLSSTSTPEGIRFIRAWAQSTGQKICGVHADTPGCRDAQFPDPKPGDPLFEVQGDKGCVKGKVAPEFQKQKSEIVEGIKRVLSR